MLRNVQKILESSPSFHKKFEITKIWDSTALIPVSRTFSSYANITKVTVVGAAGKKTY